MDFTIGISKTQNTGRSISESSFVILTYLDLFSFLSLGFLLRILQIIEIQIIIWSWMETKVKILLIKILDKSDI